jgi:hypothetical protein
MILLVVEMSDFLIEIVNSDAPRLGELVAWNGQF